MAKTIYVSKKNKKGKTRRVKRGGNKTDGDKLMDALHENSKIPDAMSKNHSHEKIACMFNKVKENDLYHSILRKKETLNPQEKDAMYKEAMVHQEDPSPIRRIPECKFGHNCRRVNPVHKLAHKKRFYHPATLVASSMNDESF
jgi:hypothetical protein